MSDILDFLLYGLLKALLLLWFCGVVFGAMVVFSGWLSILQGKTEPPPVLGGVYFTMFYLLFSSGFFAVWRWKGEDLF